MLLAILSSGFSYWRDAIYLEIGGQGIGVSLNYEKKIHDNFSIRIGASYMILGAGGILGVNYITHPESSHHLEIGLGVTYMYASLVYDGISAAEDLLPSLSVGYRYQPPERGFFFRAAFTTFFDLTEKSSDRFGSGENLSVVFIPLGGVALGWSF